MRILLFRPLLKRLKISSSQCGEDLIVAHLMEALAIRHPSYLDIGTHHPSLLNNTYLFYLKGSRGVCIEPDPTLFAKLKSKRKRDVCLNVGIGFDDRKNGDFYIMSANTLSTFSKEEAQRYQAYGHHRIERVITVPLLSVDQILREYFSATPDFISLDTEGLDFQILQTFNFSRYRPTVFCIETLTYTEDNSEQKVTAILDHMKRHRYLPIADTYINTIFVDSERWENRPFSS